MPLHLLGKKSWNVYNSENIERVKRDEAEAKAREEEDERRMQKIDAERRIQLLRGERPSTPPPPPPSHSTAESHHRSERKYADGAGQHRKRRRLAGEDDTDRDIRLAREDATQASAARDRLALTSSRDGKDAQVSLVDSTGHINLFPAASGNKKAEKNAEAEAEAAKKKRSYEDQYTMRFSNAAGFKEKIGHQPWYSSSRQNVVAPDSIPGKDVWGNEDPRRKEREKARVDSNDPLAAMKRGVRQLRATEQERKRWNEEKGRELEALKFEERHRSSHRRRRRSRSEDSLEGFRLDAPAAKLRDQKEHSGPRRPHRHHREDRSRDRSHRQSSHRSERSRRPRDRTHEDTRPQQRSEKSSTREKH